jgi:DNA-directed RNA polymerase specialized sigma24 family protein
MTARLDAWPTPPEPEQLHRLRQRLLNSTRGAGAHVPSRDAEDVVQNAMVRYLREAPKPNGPNDDIRAHVALRRERANYFRTRERKPEQLTHEPQILRGAPATERLGHVEAAVAIEQIAGVDARRIAELRGEGHTLDDAARILHWDANRVEAARKQFERHKDMIARALNRQLKEEPNGTVR